MICPATLRFRGTVIAATAGVVRYRFRLDDGPATPYVDMTMKEKEARDVVHLLRIGSAANTAVRGTLQFEVRGSRGAQRATASFAVTCERETGEHEEENPLATFGARYFGPRGDSLDEFSARRLSDYEQLRAMRKAQDKPRPGPPLPDPPAADPCTWSSIGPTNIGGRVTRIAIDPTNNQRVFLATVGGIWRSTDGARRWQRVSDDFLAGTFASVAINPGNQAEVFAGGGDPNFHSAVTSGVGIWRSTANGDPGTWTKVSPPALDGRVIYRLRIDPSAPNAVYAATSDGVYIGTRSAGSITFARLSGFDAWTTDIAVDFSANPRLVYAGVLQASATYSRGVWKYDGATWNQRTSGIPTTDSGTISLALARSNPAVLYAHVAAASTGQLQGAYKTGTAAEPPTAGADAWMLVAGSATLNDGPAAFNSAIEVDPTNTDIVWSGGVNLYRTSDGGTTWSNVASGTDVSYPVFAHNDHHAVAFDPANSKVVYVGTDGGLFRSTDTSQTSWHWNNVSHGLNVTQFFKLSSQQSLAGIAAGGTQDNGVVLTFGNRTWYQPFFCDGWMVAFDAANASTLYLSCAYFLFILTNPVPGTGGSNLTWTLPAGVAIRSPIVTDRTIARAALAVGTNGTNERLLKTTDGVNWSNASPNLPQAVSIATIGIAPSSAFQTYYVATADLQIWRTTDGGTTWTQTSTGLAGPWFWTYSIAVDATNPARAVAATTRGLFFTTDTGAHWDSISGTGTTGLPSATVMGAVFDPSDPDTVYAVTPVGAFRGTITPAVGTTPAVGAWTAFDEGLPDGLPVSDIWVNPITKRLKIASMGYGAFERDIRPGITCPSTRLLIRDNVIDRGETPSPSGVPDPEHPIPDPARPPFFKPDDTAAGRLYWWSSTDVRIDVPSTAPAKNLIPSADHVEFETCPIHASDCPAGTMRDAAPQRGRAARVYVQVNNIGLRPATNVRVTALFADASAGLPNLPVDFWTTTFPAGSSNCGALTPGSGWQFADAVSPCRVIPAINPDLPETVRFDWNVPAGQAGHSCMLVISESNADPIHPNVRATNERRLSELVPNNRQISLRNLHVIDAAAGTSNGMEAMDVSNPDRELSYVDLIVSRVDLPRDAVVGFLLPTRKGVESEGAQPARLTLSATERALARELNVSVGRVLPRQRRSRSAYSRTCPARPHVAARRGLQNCEDSDRIVGAILGDCQARRDSAGRKYLHHPLACGERP